MGRFKEILDVMLPVTNMGKSRFIGGINEGFGTERSATRRHYGIDFNYHYGSGARLGQRGLNTKYPIVYSPVSGTVVYTGGEYGRVDIDDGQGYIHQVLHLNVKSWGEFITDAEIKIGHAIGRMGKTHSSHFHCHYQIVTPKSFKEKCETEPHKYKYSAKSKATYIDPQQFDYKEFKSAYPPGQFEDREDLMPNPFIVLRSLRGDIFEDNPFIRDPRLVLPDDEHNPRIPDYLLSHKRFR